MEARNLQCHHGLHKCTSHPQGDNAMMMDMTTMPTGMMIGAAIYHLIIVVFALLGSAAFIKYLRS
jgi:hypothetical protein